MTDTQGFLLGVVVHEANIQDRDGAKCVFEKIGPTAKQLKRVWADGGYAGKLIEWVSENCDWTLEIVKRSDDQKGFKIIPRRWVVERTFAWMARYRRLSKDYEFLTETTEAMMYLSMTRLMLHRLEKNS